MATVSYLKFCDLYFWISYFSMFDASLRVIFITLLCLLRFHFVVFVEYVVGCAMDIPVHGSRKG